MFNPEMLLPFDVAAAHEKFRIRIQVRIGNRQGIHSCVSKEVLKLLGE